MKANTQIRGTVLLDAFAAGMTFTNGPATAQTADTTGCTPQEKSAQTLNQKTG